MHDSCQPHLLWALFRSQPGGRCTPISHNSPGAEELQPGSWLNGLDHLAEVTRCDFRVVLVTSVFMGIVGGGSAATRKWSLETPTEALWVSRAHRVVTCTR